MMKTTASVLAAAFIAGITGCLWIKSDPVEVEPIHVTVDVNVRMKRELQDFFGEIDKADPTIKQEKSKQVEE